MEKMQQSFFTAALLLVMLAAPAFPQEQGTVSGMVFGAANGEPLSQITVEMSGPTTVQVQTNQDGSFRTKAPPGTYNVTYTGPNHLPQTVEGLEVVAGEVVDASTVLAEKGEVTRVEVVESVAPEIATAETLLVERKLANTVSDSISGKEIQQSTASDAAGALEKVTGISVVEDRFVYVRGLGERYSATTLNNSLLATTEPERRVVPLDLFPAALIDNIKVRKTYSPDLPGEFSAGLVQIQTAEFPSQATMSASYSVGFNTQTHGDDFFRYPGGDLDFFGIDDGTRDLPGPIPANTRVDRFNFSADELQELGRSFDTNWEIVPRRDIKRPSQTWNFVAGNTIGKLGLVGAFTFSNSVNSIFDQDRIFYQPGPTPGDRPLAENIFVYDESTEAVRLGGIFNVSYQLNSSNKLAVRNFLSRDTDDNSRFFTGFHQDFNTDIRNQRLRFIERELINTQLQGEHLVAPLAGSIFTWQLAFSRATRDEPNLRESLYLLNQRTGAFEFTDDSQSAFRMFNDLDETIWNPGVDWSVPFFSGGVTGSVSFGANLSFRQRDFESRRFRLVVRGNQGLDITNPPNDLFTPENVRPTGLEINETTRVTDAYDGTRDVFGYYGMMDIAFSQNWRFIGGLRIEDVDQNVTSFDQFNPGQSRNEAPFDSLDYLPAANLIYQITPKQNLRFGFSQTVSRPDFRELALFDFLDVTGGRLTVGNPDLVQTNIRNWDVRWEMFPGGNQLMAASFFWKNFDNPIERTVQATVGLLTTFDNARSARNLGFELEFRRDLGTLAPALRGLAVSSNFTFVDSNINLADVIGVITTRDRPMQGQSRYVANGIVEWTKPQYRSTARFYANFFSDRITDVGSFGLPDVIQQGVTTLDFIYEFDLADEGRWKLRFAAENFNDPKWLWLQGGLTFQRWQLGRSFTVGTSYRFY